MTVIQSELNARIMRLKSRRTSDLHRPLIMQTSYAKYLILAVICKPLISNDSGDTHNKAYDLYLLTK